jgi:S1-C subfamily serine protease
MKRVLLLVVLSIVTICSFGGQVFAVDVDKLIQDWTDEQKIKGYFDGNPNETEVLEKTKDYIVLRNLTAKAEIYMSTMKMYQAAEVFGMEGTKHCEKNDFFTVVYAGAPIALDEHTSYIICKTELGKVLGEDEASFLGICLNRSETSKDYKLLNCKKLIKEGLQKYPNAKTLNNKINAHNQKYENNKFIYELKKRVFAKASQPSISTEDQNTVVAASSGTGFFVSTNGHMVTNNHVIDSCDTVKAHYKGRELDADVLFTDRSNDLAIIKANIKPEKVFPVSNDDVSLLEDIIVAGYPLGKNISASIKTFKGSVTALAGFGDNYSNFQIDASLSSGNSGGPIINQKGNVVGVAVEKLVEVGVEGFNFGVKSSTLKTFASSNQIKFEPASTEELSNKELGQLITEATIYLECWMSVAKIKQIIEEGERQKAFFSEYK